MPSIGFNPIMTSNATGSFNVESTGYIQGQAQDSPAIRFQLSGGVLDPSETLPMWGGVGIYENIPGGAAGSPGAALGGAIGRATQFAAGAKQLTGFSVFDQAHHMVQSPQSEVPVSLQGMSVHFYRFKSGARIPVAVDPALVDLQGQIITSDVSWDFVNQKLIAGVANQFLPVYVRDVKVTNCMTVSYDAATGFATWNRQGACAVIEI